jgi:hypothetical protein
VETFCGLGRKGITGGAPGAPVEKAETATITKTSVFTRRLIPQDVIFVVRFAGSVCVLMFFIREFSFTMIDVLFLERTILARRKDS